MNREDAIAFEERNPFFGIGSCSFDDFDTAINHDLSVLVKPADEGSFLNSKLSVLRILKNHVND